MIISLSPKYFQGALRNLCLRLLNILKACVDECPYKIGTGTFENIGLRDEWVDGGGEGKRTKYRSNNG